jgi:hypothetical protein
MQHATSIAGKSAVSNSINHHTLKAYQTTETLQVAAACWQIEATYKLTIYSNIRNHALA